MGTYVLYGFAFLGLLSLVGLISMVLRDEEDYYD